MARPKEHDEETAAALLVAAERLVADGGADALSVRAVADAAHTTTRAVYSLFGSKDGLVAALAQRMFEYLYSAIDALDDTDDPAAYLVEIGATAYRRLVLEHPALYRIAFQRIVPGLRPEAGLTAARERAFAQLLEGLRRAKRAKLLGGTPVRQAAVALNAMFEGLANAQLRGAVLPILPAGSEEDAWREALRTVVRGFRKS